MGVRVTRRAAIAEQLADILSGPCPATATEFHGGIMRCVLPRGHTDIHTDGCVGWLDPYGEIDADQHPEEPWRDAYDAFCEAMDWTGEEPAVVPLFGRDE